MKGSRDLKVGVFVLAGLILSAMAIFLIGDERRLFERAVDFHAKFSDVQGLKPGAPVRMGGIDIGHVTEVGYGGTSSDTTIYVTLSIVRAESSRIKTDSLARIATKGLLGDKMIEVTKGKDAASVPPGGEIKAEEPDDMLGKVGGMANKADEALSNVNKITASLADERLQRDIRESVSSINIVLKQVAEGDGYPHRLLTDKAEAERISRTIQNLDRTSQELVATMNDVRGLIDRVKTGPGFAHDVIYDDTGTKTVASFGQVASEAAQTLKGIRESQSFAHDVIYGGKNGSADALANITAATADLRAITGNLRAGKGTIGALLVDPSIYEDMKSVLGNVERNDVLRALVRYSIKQDEKKPAVEIGGTK